MKERKRGEKMSPLSGTVESSGVRIQVAPTLSKSGIDFGFWFGSFGLQREKKRDGVRERSLRK